jgi:outer membrane receptor for ferrienterochelin and colicins
MKSILLSFILIISLTPEAFSEEKDLYTFPPIQVLGERTLFPSTTFFSFEEIEEIGATDLGEVLKGVEGAFVKEYGGPAGLKTLSLRGVSPEGVRVFLDGIPLNSMQTGLVDLSTIPVHIVDRVEVIRGGGFSHSAVGGVINLVTKSGETQPISFFNSTLGSFQTRRLNLGRFEKMKRWNYAVSLEGEKSENDYSYQNNRKEELRRNADYTSYDLFTKVGYEVSPSSRITLSSIWTTRDQGDPGNLTLPTPNAKREEDKTLFDIQYEKILSENWGLKAILYHQNGHEHYENPDPPFNFRDTHEEALSGMKIQQEYVLHGKHRITWELSGDLEKLESTKVGEKRRESGYTSIQGIIQSPLISGLTFHPSLQLDQFSDGDFQVFSPEDRELSPRFSLLYSKRMLSLFGGIGKNFRTPTFNELFWPEDPFARGNPDLSPESSIQLEGGSSYRFDREINNSQDIMEGEIEVNLFRQSVSDLILWQQDAGGKWNPGNIGQVENKGIETQAEINYQLSAVGFKTSLNYTYLSAKDVSGDPNTDGMQLIYRPHHMANLSSGVRVRSFQINFQEHFVGERPVTRSNSKWLPHYFITDFNIAYKPLLWDATWTFKIGSKNFFDEQYEVIRDYPQPGREWRFSMGVTY